MAAAATGHLLVLSFVNVGELLVLALARSWGERKLTARSGAVREHFVVLPFTIAITEQWAPLHTGRGYEGGRHERPLYRSLGTRRFPTDAVGDQQRERLREGAADHPLLLIHPELLADGLSRAGGGAPGGWRSSPPAQPTVPTTAMVVMYSSVGIR